jgi:hypothetical protein
MSTKINSGNNTSGLVNVDGNYQLKVVTETDAYNNGQYIGAIRSFGEVDGGLLTGDVKLKPIEIDNDYRQRVSQDFMADEEIFNYTAQNTAKFSLVNTTMTGTFTAGQYTTNASSINTISTGCQLSTYANFPVLGTATLSLDCELGFSEQPKTNTFVEWGLGDPGTQLTEPIDGIFFRLSPAGLQGVASFNGAETTTGIFPLSNGNGIWVYQDNKRYQFICYQSMVEAVFWVNDGNGAVMLGSIPLPTAQARMSMSSSAKVFFKHRIVGGAASGSLQCYVGAYNVRIGGINYSTLPGSSGNRIYGSYQGLSGGTMGSLANYANSANPTPAVPTNTTAALGTGLGGQFWETDTLAVNTDGIICSYFNPLGTVNFAGRRLVIRYIKIDSYVQTSLTGGGYVAQWSLAFGHTAVSLATAESANTKAPRRIPLGIQSLASGAVALTTLQSVLMDFGDAPIFVNPGEFIQVVKKKIGTAPTAGVIGHLITITYGWE